MLDNNAVTGVSIIIPNWNGLYLLKQSLDPLLKAVDNFKGKAEVIVVDNGSQDRSVDVMLDYYPNIQIKRFSHNTGFGYACNSGVELAKYSHVLFLNNDIYIPDNLIEVLVSFFKDKPDSFSVSPQTNFWRGKELTSEVFSSSINFSFNSDGELIQHWAVNQFNNIAERESPTIYGTGAVLLVNKSKFIKLGGFDSIYGLAYWEDVDLCLRAWRKGWGSYYTSEIIAWHKVSASSGGDKLEFKRRMMVANYIIFHLINVADIKITLRFINSIRKYHNSLKKKGEYEMAKYLRKKIFKLIPGILIRKCKLIIGSELSLNEIISQIPMPAGAWKSGPVLYDD